MTSLRTRSDKERDKMFDLKKLKEIINTITDIEEENITFKRCMLRIGKLSGGITVNGEIWKQYGPNQQRSNMNKTWIAFDKLSHLENIASDDQIFSFITDEEIGQLTKAMSYLKHKIVYILHSDNHDVRDMSSSEEKNESISKISVLSDKYFEMLTTKLIKREINILETIDFNIKDDRYFIGRLLSKIGELINELINDLQIPKKSEIGKDLILQAFKNLVSIRNKLLHNHGIITEGIKDQNDIITKLVADLRNHLRFVFTGIDAQFYISYHYENAKKFEDDSKKLLKCLSGKLLSIKDHTNELNKIMIQAYEMFRVDTSGLNKIKNKLKQINKQYQSHLNELKDFDTIDYPSVLSIETKDEIIRKGEILKGDISTTDVKVLDSNSETQKKENIEDSIVWNVENKDYKTLIDEKDYGSLLFNEIKYFVSIRSLSSVRILSYVHGCLINDHAKILVDRWTESIKNFHKKKRIESGNENENINGRPDIKDYSIRNEKTDPIYFEIDHFRDSIFIQTDHLKSEQLDKEFEKTYPEFYDEWKKNKKDKNNKVFQDKIDDLCQEMFQSLTSDKDIDSRFVIECFNEELRILVCEYVEIEVIKYPELKRYDYITQQVVLHMQQLIIDAHKFHTSQENIKDSSVQQKDFIRVFSCFTKYITSRRIHKEIRLCKGYRSSGLAHKVLSFDRTVFLSDTITDAINLSDYLKCCHRVLKIHNVSTVKDFYDMAVDLHKISLKEKSTEYLKTALKQAEDRPDEIERHELDDEYLKIFHKPRLICKIKSLLCDEYYLPRQDDDMNEMIKEIIDNIDMEELMKCNISEIRRQASGYYNNIGTYYRNFQRDYNRALESYRTADSIFEDNQYKTQIAITYFEMMEFDKAREMCQSILVRDGKEHEKMFASLLLFSISSHDPTRKNSIESMRTYLAQIESLYISGKYYLKSIMPEDYYTIDLTLMSCELNIIFSEVLSKQEVSVGFLERLANIDKKFKNLKRQLDYTEFLELIVADIHLLLCNTYCEVCNYGELSDFNSLLVLQNAKRHFIYALRMPNVQFSKENAALIRYGGSVRFLVVAHIGYVKRHSKRIDARYLIELAQVTETMDPEFTADMFHIITETLERETNKPGYESVFDSKDDWDIFTAYQMKIEVIYQCNLEKCKTWLSLYYNISNAPHLRKHECLLRKQQTDIKEFLTSLLQVFVAIMNKDDVVRPNEYLISICHRKYDVEISFQNERLQWKYKGNSSEEAFLNMIKTELRCISELLADCSNP